MQNFNSKLRLKENMKKIIPIIFLLLLLVISSNADSGEMKLLATSEINNKLYGNGADLFLEIKPGSGRIFIDSFPLTKLDTVMSTRFANEIACDFIDKDCVRYDFFYTIRANTAIVGGPSAGAAISILTISVLEDIPLRKDAAITGTINSGGLIGPVSGIKEKATYASKINMTKVMIPRWSNINETELENMSRKRNIEIKKVSNLREAFYEMTGVQIGKNYSLIVSSDYVNKMKNISEKICKRSLETKPQIINNRTKNADELFEKGKTAKDQGKYYSSASYCFGANVQYRYASLLNEDLSEKDIIEIVNEYKNKSSDFKDFISRKEIDTITDLQTLMVVTERIIDSKEYLDNSLVELMGNNTNMSVYNLAFGIERLNSAVSWSMFFGDNGKTFEINEKTIKESCLEKISEVEERVEYVKQYFPYPSDSVNEEVSYAHRDYNNGDYSLCLFKASKAKAEIDIFLNSIGIKKEQLGLLIDERLGQAEQIIGKQIENNVFPIIGFSYYEYAKSLKDTDQFSSLLYLEYAIELSKLDIYFKQESFKLPIIEEKYLILFGLGFIWGFLVCFIWVRHQFIGKKK
ncbi:hypothetical protein GF327_04685 [Candidatus Woesearchaeota archaeon]|nr:hypothetical protein [Candidatus Woesearchaeota archaeon]